MRIEPCNTYHGILDGFQLLRKQPGLSAFKIYYCSIIGRSLPERFEWQQSALTCDQFTERFAASDLAGVGFVIAFPHIVKVFRFAPKNEVLQHVCALNPQTWEPIGLDRGEGYTEFACYAEAIIAADEFRYWAAATSVEEYLATRTHAVDYPIVCNSKLRAYWQEG